MVHIEITEHWKNERMNERVCIRHTVVFFNILNEVDLNVANVRYFDNAHSSVFNM